MNQYVRTNKHEDRNFSYNEWINAWINTYEQVNIKIKGLPAMNESMNESIHMNK